MEVRYYIYKTKKLISRFNEKVELSKSGCWEWTSVLNWKGYGRFSVSDKGRYKQDSAHRVSYAIHIGKIPKGLTVHHKCHNRKCVNPKHLELKTNDENRLEGNCWSAINSRKTHCKRGHEFTEENTYRYLKKIGTKHRSCKMCMRMHQEKYRLNK